MEDTEGVFDESLEVRNDDTEITDEEYEELSAKEVLEQLIESWKNEKFSPEILPHKFDLVDCMLTQLHHMERNLKKLPKGDIRIMLHQMEIDRIRFVITNYVKIRLEKIEKYPRFILNSNTANQNELITESETQYATQFLRNQYKLFQTNALGCLNEREQLVDFDELEMKPNELDVSQVFIKVRKDLDGVKLDDEIVNLKQNDQYFTSYNDIKHLVSNNTVNLI